MADEIAEAVREVTAAITALTTAVLALTPYVPTEESPRNPQSNLVKHARREMKILGIDEDEGDQVARVIQAVADMGLSGGAASYYIPMLNDLLLFKNLTPLTDLPAEWNEVGVETWQNSRNSEAFSLDGGRTYYLLSEKESGKYEMHDTVRVYQPGGKDGGQQRP